MNKIFNKIKENKWLFIILLIGSFLRFYKLGFQEFWLDELSTFQVSDPTLSFGETHNLILSREGFPHFYFLSLKYLSKIFGHSVLTLRFFSTFFGIASVYLIFLFTKELFNKKAGYIASLLLAVNYFHIYHSQEARAYSLMVFFILLSSYRMMLYIKDSNFKNAIFLGITCGLIPNAHPIGVLNIGVIYSTLFIYLLLNKNKLIIFKQLLVSFLLTVVVFSPVYQIISKVSEIKSFWIPAASLETIKQAFFEMLGSSNYVLSIYLLSIVFAISFLIYKIFRKDNNDRNKTIIILSLVFFWISINIGVIIIKSYVGISIILNRYFIGSLCLFIICLAYCFSMIENKYLRNGLIFLFGLYSLFFIYDKKYYTSISKTQWISLANEIIKINSDEDKIYGAYGFTSNILFKNTPSYKLMKEITFEDYITSVRNNNIKKESFWYFDGNFRPYNLNLENQHFLQENYILDYEIDKYDCWAKHYSLKNSVNELESESKEIYLNEFESGILDNEGNLLIFENKTIQSNKLKLQEGIYKISLEANSLPKTQIDNENAHLILMWGEKKIGECFLSEKEKGRLVSFNFVNKKEAVKKISITYDNDLFKDNLDRNVIIYRIKLERIDKR